MNMRSEVNMLKDVIRNPWAWPGGYEKALVMDDGGVVCHHCAKSEFWNILHSTRGEYRDGWQVSGVFLVDDCEGPVFCDHCSKDLLGE